MAMAMATVAAFVIGGAVVNEVKTRLVDKALDDNDIAAQRAKQIDDYNRAKFEFQKKVQEARDRQQKWYEDHQGSDAVFAQNEKELKELLATEPRYGDYVNLAPEPVYQRSKTELVLLSGVVTVASGYLVSKLVR